MEETEEMKAESTKLLMGARLEAANLTAHILTDLVARSWGVMHGAEGFPFRVGRDLDILITPSMVNPAAKAISRGLQEAGWTTSVVVLPWEVTQVIASKELQNGSSVAFEADLVARQVWCGISLVVGPPSTEHLFIIEDRMICDVWGGFVKALLVQSLAANWPKLEKRKNEWQLNEYSRGVALAGLVKLAGKGAATGYIQALCSLDMPSLQAATKYVRRGLLLRGLANPPRLLKSLSKWWVHRRQQKTISDPHAPILFLKFRPEVGSVFQSQFLEEVCTTINEALVFPGIRTMTSSTINRVKVIHSSSMGFLSIVTSSDELEAGKIMDWFPKEGVFSMEVSLDTLKSLELSENFASRLTSGLMASFHKLNSNDQETILMPA